MRLKQDEEMLEVREIVGGIPSEGVGGEAGCEIGIGEEDSTREKM